MFEDKVAIVTGAGRGIGLATAALLAHGGARVLVADVDADAAEQAAAELPDARAFVGDLTLPEAPERLVEAATGPWGRLDVVVNNAGYTYDGPIHKMSDEQFAAMLAIHAFVPFRVLRAAAPHLREPAKKEREQGVEVFRKVVNVTSISGTMGNAAQANYSSGKAAVVGLTKTLAKEWGQFKINVNAVAFGVIDTRLTLGLSERAHAAMADLITLGRPGTVEEAAGAIAFLCSPWSNYVQGQVLNVTGGITMGMSS